MARPEQTEKPTPKRRSEARKKGQVPRSQELAGAVIFFALVFVIYGFLPKTVGSMLAVVGGAVTRATSHEDFTPHSVILLFAQAVGPIALFMGLLFAIAFLIGIVANVAQFGLLFSLKAIQPSFGKLNPITGFGRLFSKQILVNLGKQALKLAGVLLILYTSISSNLGLFASVGQTDPNNFVFMVAGLIFELAWKFGLMLVLVGFIDLAWTRWQYEDSLKMSKQEVKDEMRQSEGNPEAKAALKRKQREFARRRMMASVPKATVVVTNPTHYAVALEWDEIKMEAPVVTAKGVDLVAKRIRQIAEENDVPIMENPPLARTLYERVELDQAIPPNLYAAVAQVIAFVFRLKRKTIA
ncbi:MAG TPA: flagellar biosynthesis protein FlhB [Verrucomicrobiae bacterium]|nr:flagellar biosynthesis protein FlhB [Verrucomicrobiae bacterium]